MSYYRQWTQIISRCPFIQATSTDAIPFMYPFAENHFLASWKLNYECTHEENSRILGQASALKLVTLDARIPDAKVARLLAAPTALVDVAWDTIELSVSAEKAIGYTLARAL